MRHFNVTHYQDLQESPLFRLISRIVIPPSPPLEDMVALPPTHRDSINSGSATDSEAHPHHATFVDDNLIAELAPRIQLDN